MCFISFGDIIVEVLYITTEYHFCDIVFVRYLCSRSVHIKLQVVKLCSSSFIIFAGMFGPALS